MQPPNELRDPSPVAGWSNKLLAYIKTLRLVEGVGYKLTRTARGTSLVIEKSSSQSSDPGTIEQWKFKEMRDDKLLCVQWDGTNEGLASEIWKPYKLRKTPFHGQTITYTLERSPGTLAVTYSYSSATKRTATSAAGTETQYVTPQYKVDDVIYAVRCPQLDNDYIDLNLDGRAWAEFS